MNRPRGTSTRHFDRDEKNVTVLWHGGMVGSAFGDGSKGSLLPAYESSSSWTLVENALLTRLGWRKTPRRSESESAAA